MQDYSSFDSLKQVGSNWISFSPFAYMRNSDSGRLVDSVPRQWYGENYIGISNYIDSAHHRGLSVLINPHIWIVDGTFTGDLNLNQEENKKWQEAYTRFILKFAALCEKKKVKNMSLFISRNTSMKKLISWLISRKEIIGRIRRTLIGRICLKSSLDFNQLNYY